jgi:hypothetical protein
MARIVAVTGVAPAVGTSTLARGLRDWFTSCDLRVDLVEEDEVLTRPVFAPMARELAVTGSCTIGTLAECVTSFARESAESDADLVVSDSLFPFVRSLSDWDNGEIAIDGFLAECTAALGSVPFTLVYLDADIHVAFRNAAAREPAGWLDWYITNLIRNEQTSNATHLDLAVGILDREREVALRLMAGHHWDVRRIPETELLTIDEVMDRAQRHLELSGVVPSDRT